MHLTPNLQLPSINADPDETTEGLPIEAQVLAISSLGWALYANGAFVAAHRRTGRGAAQLPTAEGLADAATNTAMFDLLQQVAALQRAVWAGP